MPELRAAVPSDAPVIFRFIRELAEYEKEPDAVKVTVEQLQAQMQSPHPPFECLIAEADGRPQGFALFFQNYSTWRGRPGLYLEDLYVTPAARGQGLGKALLARLAQIAVERDYARVEWAVLDWNTPSIEFYEALGARPMSDWKTYRLTDEALARLAAS